MAQTTDAISQPLDPLNLLNNSSRGAEACQTFPLELWHIIYNFLQLDAEADILQWSDFVQSSRARDDLRNLGQTSRSLYRLYLSISNEVIYIRANGSDERLRSRYDSGKTVKTVWLEGDSMEVSKALNSVPGPQQLILRGYHLCEPSALHWVTVTPTVESLKLLRCPVEGDFSILSSFTTDELYSVVDLRKSNVKLLDLNNSYADTQIRAPRTSALLALIPSLETLTTTPRSFRAIAQLPTTLDLPPLRTLMVVSYPTGSISQTHLLSFLRRCPTLESLRISSTIFSRALASEELPADMPNLKEYEGRPEYLTLTRAPALRWAVVKSLEWDGGALILSLASTSLALEGVVLEFGARMDDPIIESIKRWMEGAAARCSPNWRSTERFSLVIRTDPLGEWIYSAKVGRTDSGELFAEWYREREEAMAYLATSVN